MGIHQGPVAVFAHALHEQVGNPQAVEQAAGADFVLAGVLLQVEPFEDVGVPGLEVDGEAALALAATLVDVGGGGVKGAQHRHQAVGGAAGAVDGRAGGADVVHVQADTAGQLARSWRSRSGS